MDLGMSGPSPVTSSPEARYFSYLTYRSNFIGMLLGRKVCGEEEDEKCKKGRNNTSKSGLCGRRELTSQLLHSPGAEASID
ncbi:unnamed protein product [Pieris brassicae]|uniref:Uncharacterized protein n=1 Tax=Pieris brassicae TaxID=7116 RepID=A0A9P0XB71_PIEBR|nr:unnamed protein product [Pieris brassicae]